MILSYEGTLELNTQSGEALFRTAEFHQAFGTQVIFRVVRLPLPIIPNQPIFVKVVNDPIAPTTLPKGG